MQATREGEGSATMSSVAPTTKKIRADELRLGYEVVIIDEIDLRGVVKSVRTGNDIVYVRWEAAPANEYTYRRDYEVTVVLSEVDF